eukprot:3741091-Amphidinium_carterae.1
MFATTTIRCSYGRASFPFAIVHIRFKIRRLSNYMDCSSPPSCTCLDGLRLTVHVGASMGDDANI